MDNQASKQANKTNKTKQNTIKKKKKRKIFLKKKHPKQATTNQSKQTIK